MQQTTHEYDTLVEAIDELREIHEVIVSMGWVYATEQAERRRRRELEVDALLNGARHGRATRDGGRHLTLIQGGA